jgi:hypothetical protein
MEVMFLRNVGSTKPTRRHIPEGDILHLTLCLLPGFLIKTFLYHVSVRATSPSHTILPS